MSFYSKHNLGAEKLVLQLKKNEIPIGICTGSTDRGFKLKSTNHSDFFRNFDFILCCSSDDEVKER